MFEVEIQPSEGKGQLVMIKLKHKLNDNISFPQGLKMADYFITREDRYFCLSQCYTCLQKNYQCESGGRYWQCSRTLYK